MPASFPPPAQNFFNGVTTQAGALTALGLGTSSAVTYSSLVLGSPTGGNKGAGTINATAIYVNGNAVGGGLTVPNSTLIGGNGSTLTSVTAIDGLVIGGVTPASGTFTTLSATGAVNSNVGQFKFAGNVALGIYGTPGSNTTTLLGSNAGAAQSTTVGNFNTFIGDSAGQFTQPGFGENTFIGNLAGVYNQTGHQCVYEGAGAGWFEQSSFNVALGSDCYRNVVSSQTSGNNVAVGLSSQRNGSGYQNTSVGSGSMQATATTIVLSGTQTTGDVVTLTFNAPASTIYGYSALVNVHASATVTAGMTTAQLASALIAAINATVPALLQTGTQAAGGGALANMIVMTFAGTAATGAACVVTSSVSGSATEIVTITPGFSGFGNTAIGFQAMSGPNLQSASNNFAGGFSALANLTTGNGNVAIGQQAGQNILASGGGVFIGALAGSSATAASSAVAVGSNALAANVTSSFDVAIGGSAMQNYIGTGSGEQNVAVGGFALQGATGSTFFAATSVGYNSGKLVSTGHDLVIVGYAAGSKITSGAANTVIGSQVASTTLATGGGNILIGVDSSTDTAASGTNDTIIIKGRSGGTAVLSATATNGTPQTVLGGNVWGGVSIGTGGLTGPTWTTGAGTPSSTQPVGSLYSNTTGTAGARLYVSAGSGTWTAVAVV